MVLPNKGGYFLYTAYIVKAEPSSTIWTRCEVQVTPYGHGIDHYQKVYYSISEPGLSAVGDVRIPVPVFGAGHFIDVASVANPATIDLSSGSGVDLKIKNLLSDMQVHVVSRAEIYFGHPGFWNPPSGLIA